MQSALCRVDWRAPIASRLPQHLIDTGKVILASYLGTIKAMEGTEGSAIHA